MEVVRRGLVDARHSRNASLHGPVVTDGAWGTQLQSRGLPVGACPDAWNLSHPEAVEAVARAYVEAGSRIILTNTFGANRVILARHGPGRPRRGNQPRRRGDLAAGRGRAGKGLRLDGAQRRDAHDGRGQRRRLLAAFSEQARAMADAGANGIVIETMTDPAEARLAVAAAKETGLPVVACMTFDSGAQLDRTMMGATPEQAAEQLLEAGADMIGSNCGQGVAGFVEICRRLHAASGRAVWVKANAGLPQMRDGKTTMRRLRSSLPPMFRNWWPPAPDSWAVAAARRRSSFARSARQSRHSPRFKHQTTAGEMEIRSSKSEIRNKLKIQMRNAQNILDQRVLVIGLSYFGLV